MTGNTLRGSFAKSGSSVDCVDKDMVTFIIFDYAEINVDL